jgi:hypothetical protein
MTETSAPVTSPTTCPDEDRWLDDGGSTVPPLTVRKKRPAVTGRRHTRKPPQDTANGCRARATADLLAAVTMTTQNARLRLESSAASWTLRADLLDRLEDSFAQRQQSSALRQESHHVWL